jgi:hypothetical protein
VVSSRRLASHGDVHVDRSGGGPRGGEARGAGEEAAEAGVAEAGHGGSGQRGEARRAPRHDPRAHVPHWRQRRGVPVHAAGPQGDQPGRHARLGGASLGPNRCFNHTSTFTTLQVLWLHVFGC